MKIESGDLELLQTVKRSGGGKGHMSEPSKRLAEFIGGTDKAINYICDNVEELRLIRSRLGAILKRIGDDKFEIHQNAKLFVHKLYQ